jgi:hypothetical protein
MSRRQYGKKWKIDTGKVVFVCFPLQNPPTHTLPSATNTQKWPFIIEGDGWLSEGDGWLSEGDGWLSEGGGWLSEGDGWLSEGDGLLSEGAGLLSEGYV